MQITIELQPIGEGRELVAWLLASFVVTFVVTRVITRMIASGRGPFRDTTIGGVHIHHQVYGIFMMIGAGTAELTYQPEAPWVQVVAVVFGAGAALTLDEFALWLRLDDVYWAEEGRRSVDAVMIAVVIGILLLVGSNPFNDSDPGVGAPLVAVNIVVNLVFAAMAILKGRNIMGIIGVFVPVVALVGACRLARPRSYWARRWYKPGSRKRERAERRFPPGRRDRWDRIVDWLARPPERRHTSAHIEIGPPGLLHDTHRPVQDDTHRHDDHLHDGPRSDGPCDVGRDGGAERPAPSDDPARASGEG